MKEPKKIYVVDPEPAVKKSRREEAKKPSQGETVSAVGASPRFSPRVALLLSYLLGPMGLLVTRRGRKDKFWLGAGVVAIPGLVFMVLKAGSVEPGSKETVFWVATSIFLAFFWLTAWTRAVHFAGVEGMFVTRLQPSWLKKTWTMTLVGLLAPGIGLQFTGRPRRGAFAFWMTLAIVFPVLVLMNARRLWVWGHAEMGLDLERVFIVSGALVLGAVFCWVIQALDGARIASGIGIGHPRSDVAAALMLAVLFAFPFSFKPQTLAESLNSTAQRFDARGLRITPLYLSMAAMKLDPSRPAYALTTAVYHERVGNTEAAKRLKGDLSARWDSYSVMIESFGKEPLLERPHTPEPLPSYPKTWERIEAIYGEDLLGALTPASASEDS